MAYMFQNTESFNQPLNSWNVSSVIFMNSMFNTAYDFNRDISMWNVSSVTTHTNFDASSNVGWTAGEKPTFP
jgi:surface protein